MNSTIRASGGATINRARVSFRSSDSIAPRIPSTSRASSAMVKAPADSVSPRASTSDVARVSSLPVGSRSKKLCESDSVCRNTSPRRRVIERVAAYETARVYPASAKNATKTAPR